MSVKQNVAMHRRISDLEAQVYELEMGLAHLGSLAQALEAQVRDLEVGLAHLDSLAQAQQPACTKPRKKRTTSGKKKEENSG